MTESKLEKLDRLIRQKYSNKLLNILSTETDEINKLEKDFQDDLEHYDLSKEESKKLFKKLKNTHL